MSKEVKIALVAIVGIVLLFFGMQFLKGLSLFSNGTTYQITFNDISGLTSSSPIYANGVKVGTITSIDFDYENQEHIVAHAEIDKRLRIPNGTTAEISSDLLGNVQVNLKMGNRKDGLIAAGGELNGKINDGAMGKVKDMVPQVEQLLPKLDSILISLNTLLADPAIAQSLHNVSHITSQLTTTTSQLNQLMGSLGKDVPGMVGRMNSVLDNANTMTANLASLDMQATLGQIDQTLANVQQLTTQLSSNQGSLGLLMNDPTLYSNLNATMSHADSLLINLREHPKRYVHFSIFGKKDK